MFRGCRRQVLRALPSRAPRAFRRKKQTPFRAPTQGGQGAKTPLLLTVSREAPFRLLPRVRHVAEVQQQLHLATKQEGKETRHDRTQHHHSSRLHQSHDRA